MKPYGLVDKKVHSVGCCPGHDDLGANKFGGSYKKSTRKNGMYKAAKKLKRVRMKRALLKELNE